MQFLLHFFAYNFSSAVILNNISGEMDDYGTDTEKFLTEFLLVCIALA